ncbi:MAG: hypothetical protein AAB390_01980, partial [Patescibacteria group bacterium]
MTLAVGLRDPFNARNKYNNGVCKIATPLTANSADGNCLPGGPTPPPNFDGTSDNGYSYQNRLYTLLQHWAWHGGMYQGGLASRSDLLNEIKVPTFDQNALDDFITTYCDPMYENGLVSSTKNYVCTDKVLGNLAQQYNTNITNASDNHELVEDLLQKTGSEITNPDAVVLYGSPLYYRNYLLTTNITIADTGLVTSSGKQIFDGTYKQAGLKPYVDPVTGKEGYTPELDKNDGFKFLGFFGDDSPKQLLSVAKKYKLTPTLLRGYNSFGSTFGENSDNSYQFIAAEPFYQSLKLYDTQIRKMHFGPMIVAKAKDSIDRAPVITIDFDKLNSKEMIEKKTETGSVVYDLAYDITDVKKGLYTFKIKMKPSNDTKYIAVKFLPTLDETNTPVAGDLSDFFKELWDIFGKNVNVGESKLGSFLANWKKVSEWKIAGGSRTAMVIWVDFAASGQMKENTSATEEYKRSQFRYNYMATNDLSGKIKTLWEMYPSLLNPGRVYTQNAKQSEKEESEKAAERGVTPFLSVVAEIKPSCADYEVVYKDNEDLSKPTNKAWTNRVWNYGSDDGDQYNDFLGFAELFINKLLRTAPWKPFGSLALPGVDVKSTDSDGLNWHVARRKFSFADPAIDGLYYGCSAPALEGFGYIYPETLMGTKFANDWPVGGCSVAGSTYGDIYNQEDVLFENTGLAYLKHFFVSSLSSVYSQSQNTDWYDSVGYDFSDDAELATGLIAPQIYSVNPVGCYGLKEAGKECMAAEANQFTINRRNFTTKDYDGDN